MGNPRINNSTPSADWTPKGYKHKKKQRSQNINNHPRRLDTKGSGKVSRAHLEDYFDTLDHLGVRCKKYVDRVLSTVCTVPPIPTAPT